MRTEDGGRRTFLGGDEGPPVRVEVVDGGGGRVEAHGHEQGGPRQGTVQLTVDVTGEAHAGGAHQAKREGDDGGCVLLGEGWRGRQQGTARAQLLRQDDEQGVQAQAVARRAGGHVQQEQSQHPSQSLQGVR